jgi:hypothetical protein
VQPQQVVRLRLAVQLQQEVQEEQQQDLLEAQV